MVEEKFLLDANSFMTPYQNFYPFDIAPGFWKQFRPTLITDNIAVMDVVKNEVDKGEDELTDWINSIENLNILDRRDRDILLKYSEVLKFLQDSPLYNDKALRSWSEQSVADPWLIAAASAKGYTLVTFEQSAGALSPKGPSWKPKIPDIAQAFGVKCVNIFYFMRQMNIVWI
jgi:hypothetical protein